MQNIWGIHQWQFVKSPQIFLPPTPGGGKLRMPTSNQGAEHLRCQCPGGKSRTNGPIKRVIFFWLKWSAKFCCESSASIHDSTRHWIIIPMIEKNHSKHKGPLASSGIILTGHTSQIKVLTWSCDASPVVHLGGFWDPQVLIPSKVLVWAIPSTQQIYCRAISHFNMICRPTFISFTCLGHLIFWFVSIGAYHWTMAISKKNTYDRPLNSGTKHFSDIQDGAAKFCLLVYNPI